MKNKDLQTHKGGEQKKKKENLVTNQQTSNR